MYVYGNHDKQSSNNDMDFEVTMCELSMKSVCASILYDDNSVVC